MDFRPHPPVGSAIAPAFFAIGGDIFAFTHTLWTSDARPTPEEAAGIIQCLLGVYREYQITDPLGLHLSVLWILCQFWGIDLDAVVDTRSAADIMMALHDCEDEMAEAMLSPAGLQECFEPTGVTDSFDTLVDPSQAALQQGFRRWLENVLDGSTELSGFGIMASAGHPPLVAALCAMGLKTYTAPDMDELAVSGSVQPLCAELRNIGQSLIRGLPESGTDMLGAMITTFPGVLSDMRRGRRVFPDDCFDRLKLDVIRRYCGSAYDASLTLAWDVFSLLTPAKTTDLYAGLREECAADLIDLCAAFFEYVTPITPNLNAWVYDPKRKRGTARIRAFVDALEGGLRERPSGVDTEALDAVLAALRPLPDLS